MEKKIRWLTLRALGVIYIALGILAIFNSFYFDNQANIFWFCYLGVFLIGVGMIANKEKLVRSQLYILIIPDIVWIVDFLSYYFIGGNTLLGIVDYIFIAGPLLPKLVSLQHIVTVPLGLYLARAMDFKKDWIWLVSVAQLAVFFVLTRLFTSAEENINCAWRVCGDVIPEVSLYPLWWFALGTIMIFLTKLMVDHFPKVDRTLKEL